MIFKSKHERIDLLISVLRNSSEEFSPYESDFIDDFIKELKKDGSLPKPSENLSTEHTSPFIDNPVLIGISLYLLAKIADALISWLAEKSIESGFTTLRDYLQARKKIEQLDKADESIQLIHIQIPLRIQIPPGISEDKIVEIINSQLKTIYRDVTGE